MGSIKNDAKRAMNCFSLPVFIISVYNLSMFKNFFKLVNEEDISNPEIANNRIKITLGTSFVMVVITAISLYLNYKEASNDPFAIFIIYNIMGDPMKMVFYLALMVFILYFIKYLKIMGKLSNNSENVITKLTKYIGNKKFGGIRGVKYGEILNAPKVTENLNQKPAWFRALNYFVTIAIFTFFLLLVIFFVFALVVL
ncbi:MAG: hypothetical protein UT66_C0012G0029 [candidate division CPR2 bacterium GW2011_GWC1_39_9]|uniref:Uncharacterized protein n=1 Tax=candidate division CPR2 bacterium GW2011_GWC2_39_10 TaxID=1618345 RepID=A0A0G0PY00_UNCC2|nr:MAG: hypothetical protein UT18_C0011G0002 [candidate division CPR2 bacterium GW2011_GWC2_39_10]KKR35188.1 MAG: hypothetical protein UT66_C0012G0029 [candidate division CPR2 bacterium GW2011_GWC1_39_9]